MKQVWKKRAVVATVLIFVCAAVYLNWRYAGGVEDTSKVLGQSTLVSGQEEQATEKTAAEQTADENDYFATARLSRKQARDNAISMLKEAEVDENATEDVLNEASESLQVLAAYTVAEAQIESLVTAKGYADCVAFMGEDSISVVVSDADGLDTTDVARIKDIVVNETDYTPQQIKIMEATA
ncbi:MAG: SpoIIIAH-like family protein [Clostridiales bacterium]|nr:SpoIIIAH-like family protein [Candidatus Cacconaster stercorequi]